MDIDDFTMLDTIAFGNFGQVFRALHISTEKEYAIKVVAKESI